MIGRISGRQWVLMWGMPTAHTMLQVYQRQLADSRGAGLTGVAEIARLSSTIRALLGMIRPSADMVSLFGEPIGPAGRGHGDGSVV